MGLALASALFLRSVPPRPPIEKSHETRGLCQSSPVMGAEVDEETKGSMRTTIKKTASGDGARCATPGWRGSGHEGTQGRRRAVRLDFTPPGRGHPGRRRASRRDPGHSADRPPDRHMDCAPSPAEGLTRRVLPPRLRRLSSAPRQIPVVCGPHRVGRGRDIERHRTHTVVNVTGCLWFPPARTAALGHAAS